MLPLERRSQSIFIVSDFAENVTVVRKKEVADQYFHRPEILLFGAVSSVVLPPEPEQGAAVSQADLKLHSSSHLVSSDFRLLEQKILFVSYDQWHCRVKDCQTVYMAFRKCLERKLEMAAARGVNIRHVDHKVKRSLQKYKKNAL